MKGLWRLAALRPEVTTFEGASLARHFPPPVMSVGSNRLAGWSIPTAAYIQFDEML